MIEEKLIDIVEPDSGNIASVTDLNIVFYTLPDKNGVDKETKFVEFVVVGKHRRWRNAIPYDTFREANKDLDI